MSTRTFVIVADPENNFYSVREGDRYVDKLVWDEMLAQVAELTHPQLGGQHYLMLTEEQHREKERARADRMSKHCEGDAA